MEWFFLLPQVSTSGKQVAEAVSPIDTLVDKKTAEELIHDGLM